MTKKILVLGATGFTGTPIAKQLQQDGFSIRLLVRNADKARKLFGNEVDVVSGSAEDTTTLPYTIFKPSWFMEALKLFVRDGRATIFGNQTLPYNFVALEDYARLVSKAFQVETARDHKIVVNGPEAFRMTEALQLYCDAVHPGLGTPSLTLNDWLKGQKK